MTEYATARVWPMITAFPSVGDTMPAMMVVGVLDVADGGGSLIYPRWLGLLTRRGKDE